MFDIMASILAQPRVDAAIHWTSHWSSRTWPALDDDMPAAVVDTLWPDERPTALGAAFELLARLLRAGELLQVAPRPHAMSLHLSCAAGAAAPRVRAAAGACPLTCMQCQCSCPELLARLLRTGELLQLPPLDSHASPLHLS